MRLTPEQVRDVALLARLRLSETELERFTTQLGAILDYIDQLATLDTEGVEPLAHGIEVVNVFREDRVEPPLKRDDALANAPKRNAEAFLVPAVLDRD
ncbi:aspartyl/glutamyl-tRNA(Asn/Gln) amidotransferase subunit C [Isosphaera pallida ATCC 43644]|jgi:aspartyl-tRNA(Asn)/glutamyl-tRNA(Gln) amidotransferase subunit C|uniref:Aspartyl/glutamyl-tRNA(Asn/Gln) amidotransferase subunit C n=1 Tax=Isosphaera pallida (strain ATCC 43644 / DSM 9630 / IS1B) TaxID=575540 RepID=E8R259_ISOPI|nr:Asp-tRNA(Asn)/Glu-tRNA(Gln) amidotransferase subunit GatC [Isosphaera pallida]ADV63489.1 aspartyl/glutamyl-tRNA(Asn/Gln) amidotransferase subunit C [Isosphaera pallida ATCC 43644]